MLKSIEKLLHTGEATKIGNHSYRYNESKNFHEYMYHGTVICEAHYASRWFRLPYKGMYANSASTKRAVNDYKRYFTDKGFTLIEE